MARFVMRDVCLSVEARDVGAAACFFLHVCAVSRGLLLALVLCGV